MDTRKLNSYLKERGISHSTIARVLGITPQGFSLKMNGRCQFKVDEVIKISHFLRMTERETYDIFLAEGGESLNNEDTEPNGRKINNRRSRVSKKG